jgi:hypothetical protein
MSRFAPEAAGGSLEYRLQAAVSGELESFGWTQSPHLEQAASHRPCSAVAEAC